MIKEVVQFLPVRRLLPVILTLLVTAGLLVPSSLSLASRCLVPDLPQPKEDAALLRAQLEAAGLWQPSRLPGRTPPPDPQVGDTWDWYIWDLGGYPVAHLKPCTVRGMGDHCYVVVDDEEWNLSIDQAAVDRIVTHFDSQSVGFFPDQGIWDLNTSHFGDPPNPLDGLDRIFLLYYRFNISADGYFWIYDQYPDGSQPFASNEADVIYLATDSGQAGGDYMLAVAAHEFQHLIHFNQDYNEDSWVEEGLGELAMWLFGHPDNISMFNSNPDNSLIAWNGLWADYIKTYLWTLYIYEQYGGQPTIWDLVHDPLNGMAGYNNALAGQGYLVATTDIFGDWVVANYLDDPGVPDGQYGYAGEELPSFIAYRTHTSYPASATGSVQNWAGEYIRLQNFPGTPSVHFNGMDIRDFRVSLLAVDPVLPTVVRFLTLDDANDGFLAFPEAAGYAEVIITVANVHAYSSASYSYTVDSEITALQNDLPWTVALGSQPNPFNPRTTISFELDRSRQLSVAVHDIAGRLVVQLANQRFLAGHNEVIWDGRDRTGMAVGAGPYLINLQGKDWSASHKVMLVR